MISLKSMLFDETAQGLVEYSLILSLVALAAIGVLIILGESLYDLYEIIKENVVNAL